LEFARKITKNSQFIEKRFKIENFSDISEIWYRWSLKSPEYHGELKFHYYLGFGPWATVWASAMLNTKNGRFDNTTISDKLIF
jgi:hypothetical protein